MQPLMLDEDERQALVSLVRARLSELAVEISHTDTRDFRDGLRREWAALERVAIRLQSAGYQPQA